MSSCERYQELISRMIDGELTAREEADLAEHIEGCAECAALFQAFSAISRQIGGDLEEAPLDLRENVMANIRREEIRKKNRLPTILRSVLSTAAVAAIVVGVYLGVSIAKGAPAGGQLSTAAYEEAPLATEDATSARYAQESAVTKDAAPEEAEPETEEAVLEEAAEEPAAPMLAAPTPEPEMADTAETTEAEAANGLLSQPEAAEEALPVWDFSHWDLALLRELLGGESTELSREELESARIGVILVRFGNESAEVPLYELDDRLYYYDPGQETVMLASLTPADWAEFLGE